MLAMQNPPQRQSGSFQGQYILAQQWPPGVISIRHPADSAALTAASTALSGWRFLFKSDYGQMPIGCQVTMLKRCIYDFRGKGAF